MNEEALQQPETPEELSPEATTSLIAKAIEDLRQLAEEEDKELREDKLERYRYLSLLWEGFTNIYWNDRNSDFSVFTDADLEEGEDLPKTINIYRPYGESIIAALSTLVPGITFYPDDAEVPEDINTADAYGRIAKLITRHNKGKLVFIKALMIMYNQGLICGYNYLRPDPKSGSIRTYTLEIQEQQIPNVVCPNCGFEMEQPVVQMCPSCGQQVQPIPSTRTEEIPQIVGYSDAPKSKPALDLFGPQFVKLPLYARKQEDIGYLLLQFEQHVSMLKSIFREKADQIEPSQDEERYKRWARMDSQYHSGYSPKDVCTVSCLWIRPTWYWNLKDRKTVDLLDKTYPNGCYAIFVNDELVEMNEENLDEHWTLSFNPLSNFIHSQPLGEPVVPIQEIRNDIVDIEVETAGHAIPETFVAPGTLDFKKYQQKAAKVGMMTQAKPQAGKDLPASFHTTAPAHLTSEVRDLKREMDADAQFVLGAYPSVFGGVQTGGSQTAHEYEQSAARALQRLGLSYLIVSQFWCDLICRSAVEFAGYIKENGDEKVVEKSAGSFLNTWIRQSDLIGRIGNVEPEYSDQLPLSWAQKWDRLSGLFQFNSPEINSVLFHPKNTDLLKRASGIDELYIPGDDGRNKQLSEFYKLIDGQPVMDKMGQPGPSIDIDPDIDIDQVHMQVLQSLLEGPMGRYVKETNPIGYQNAVLHYKRHEMNFMSKTIKPSGDSGPGEKPEIK